LILNISNKTAKEGKAKVYYPIHQIFRTICQLYKERKLSADVKVI